MKKIFRMVVMLVVIVLLMACHTSLDAFELLERLHQTEAPTSRIVDVQIDTSASMDDMTFEMPMTMYIEVESEERMYMEWSMTIIEDEVSWDDEMGETTFIRDGYIYEEHITNRSRSEVDAADMEIAQMFNVDFSYIIEDVVESSAAERTDGGYRLEFILNQEGLFAVLSDFEGDDDVAEFIAELLDDFLDLDEEGMGASNVVIVIYLDAEYHFISSITNLEFDASIEDLGMMLDMTMVMTITIDATDVAIDFPDWVDELGAPVDLTDSELLGLWEHGWGSVHLLVFDRADSVEFLEDGIVIITDDDESQKVEIEWRANDSGEFTVDGDLFTYSMSGDVLTITDRASDDWSFYREGVTPEFLFLGVWEYGIGHQLPRFHRARGVEFLRDGTVYHWSDSREFETNSTWELNEAGEMIVKFSDTDATFRVETSGERLILTDEEENARTWWREGSRENSDDDLEFLGIWEYVHGHRLVHPDAAVRNQTSNTNRSHGIEFLEDRLYFIDREGERQHDSHFWDFDEEGYLLLEEGSNTMRTLSIETSGDTLVITDEEGNTGTWFRVDTDFEDNQDWIITDYLDHFDIDDGYRIVHNVETTGDQFDFIIYDLESETAREDTWRMNDWYFIVVVKQGNDVLDVLRHDVHSSSVTVNDLVIEADLTFNGQNDLVLFSGYQFGVPDSQAGYSFRQYELFLQRGGGLEHVPSFANICSPYLDRENERLMALGRMVRSPFNQDERGCVPGTRVYEFISNEWNMVGELFTEAGGLRRERLLVDGVWQERELCMRVTFEEDDESRELCEDHNEDDIILYERIFGENPFWRRDLQPWNFPTWYER